MEEVFDRKTKKIQKEIAYGEKWIKLLYSSNFFLIKFFLYCITKFSFFSKLYGIFQKTKISKKKIVPFVKEYDIDVEEFEKTIEEFTSFNDFFIRKLKSDTRPIEKDPLIASLPVDGRYLVFQDISTADGFFVKGKKFQLNELLNDDVLAKDYENGSMVLARLSPSDYHRFHFPISCIANKARLINGTYFSVNPMALRKNISILSENKRMLTVLTSEIFGNVLCVEIGATNVGSITQTYIPGKTYNKGGEKGFFSFGGSSCILLFEKRENTF